MDVPATTRSAAMQGGGRPILLIENADDAEVWAEERVASRAGFEVRRCPGPRGDRRVYPFGACKLVEDGFCPLAVSADVIVFGLDLRRRDACDVLDALRAMKDVAPMCIQAPPLDLSRRPDLAAYPTIPHLTTDSFLDAVRRAIATREVSD